jgi:hypothetical protein
MVLNIGKYQLPYLEYSLFKGYIVENLCVQRNEAGNDCQGKCHLEKQIKSVTETDEPSDNPAGQRQMKVQTDDYVAAYDISQEANSSAALQPAVFGDVRIIETGRDVPAPPPRH